MNIDQLRRLIQEEVGSVLVEVAKATTDPWPKTFSEYRRWVGKLMGQAGAPEELVEDILGLYREGGGVAGAVEEAWAEISNELRDMATYLKAGRMDQKEHDEESKALYVGSIHDLVLDVAREYNNDWNYAPGRHGTPFNASSVAKRAEALARGTKARSKNMPKYEKSLVELMDASDVGKKILRDVRKEGAKAKERRASSRTWYTFNVTSKNATCRKVIDYIAERLTSGAYGLKFEKSPDRGEIVSYVVVDPEAKVELMVEFDADTVFMDEPAYQMGVSIVLDKTYR